LGPLPTDSVDYDLLAAAAQRTSSLPGISCEIGLRRGGGSSYIMSMLPPGSTHIAIDPYGNIEYAQTDHSVVRLDYTNGMRDEAVRDVIVFAYRCMVNFLFFNMEDTEFFARFADGVPVYDETKRIVNEYRLVHFDGPHQVDAVIREVEFFAPRAVVGCEFVFDDVWFYDHARVHNVLVGLGWSQLPSAKSRLVYRKEH
jgi:cephalosporin hydroxylase